MYLRNHIDEPEKVRIKQVCAGAHHSLVMSEEGQVYSFGYGQHGQLGLRNNINYCTAQLVRDFLDQPLAQIATGWHHSLALTTRGDLYAWGYGESGQLGIGGIESKTHFTLVESIGDKRIEKICWGGNHSWIILNQTDPVRPNYRFPRPLNDKSPQRFMDEGPLHINDEEDKLQELLAEPAKFSNLDENEKTQELDVNPETMIRKFLYSIHNHIEQDLEKREIKWSDLQCIYTDTKLCHRFVRFELLDEFEKDGKEKVDEFIREVYLEELGILHHRVQNDEDITNAQGKVVSHWRGKNGKYFTINIICNPQNNTGNYLIFTNTI